ncbi:MAG: hypothetical protein AB1445_12455 [Bacillota bacterium]
MGTFTDLAVNSGNLIATKGKPPVIIVRVLVEEFVEQFLLEACLVLREIPLKIVAVDVSAEGVRCRLVKDLVLVDGTALIDVLYVNQGGLVVAEAFQRPFSGVHWTTAARPSMDVCCRAWLSEDHEMKDTCLQVTILVTVSGRITEEVLILGS